jgi:hypothetical protein
VSVLLLFSYAFFFLSTWTEYSTFCFLFNDKEDPKRFAAAAPIIDTPVTNEPPSQGVDPVVKSPKAPVKKVIANRGSKRAKKSIDAGASPDAHQSTSSSGDVRVDTGMLSFVSCVIFTLVGKASLVAHHYTYSVVHGWCATESSPQK